jgi:hypothetical protein
LLPAALAAHKQAAVAVLVDFVQQLQLLVAAAL